MNRSFRVLLVSLVCASGLMPAVAFGAASRVAVIEGEIVYSGKSSNYWLERAFVTDGGGVSLAFTADSASSQFSTKTFHKPARAGKLVNVGPYPGGWVAAPEVSLDYRVQGIVLCKEVYITVGLEPISASLNAVVLSGRRRGESQETWRHYLRTDGIEPYYLSATGLNEGEFLVVVNGRKTGPGAALTGGDLALMTKLKSDGSELWRHQITCDGAVYVNHVASEAGELRISGSAGGQTFERWSGLNPKSARTWGFEATYSPESGQATKITQILSTESASVRRILRFADCGAVLIGGNFFGTLPHVMPPVSNVGKGATAFLVASSGSDTRLRSIIQPASEERMAGIGMAKGHCYTLILQIDSRIPDLKAPQLPARRLILRGYSPTGTLVGERELATSQFGAFNGTYAVIELEGGLAIVFSSEVACRVLGKEFLKEPNARNFFILMMSPLSGGSAKEATP